MSTKFLNNRINNAIEFLKLSLSNEKQLESIVEREMEDLISVLELDLARELKPILGRY